MNRYENIKKYHSQDRKPPKKGLQFKRIYKLSIAQSQVRRQIRSDLKQIHAISQSCDPIELMYIMPIQYRSGKTWWDCGSMKTKVY